MTAYVPTAWVNNVPPPLSAANLNKLTDELRAQALVKNVINSLPVWVDGTTPALTDAAPWNEMERVAAAVASSLGLTYTVTSWSAGWSPARNATRINKLEQQAVANRVEIDNPSAGARTLLLPWNADCIWYTPLPLNPTLNANSASMITRLNFSSGHPMNASVQNHFYGTPVFAGSLADPQYVFTSDPGYGDNFGGLPIPVPAGTAPDPSGDGHCVIVDLARELSWEFWIYTSPNHCMSGHRWNMNGTGGGEAQGGAVAARIPMLPIIVRPEEITAGRIPHVIGGSLYHLDSTRSARVGQVWPAVANDGASSNTLDIYEGTFLQLDPAVNVNALAITAWEKVIAKAMQEFGWIAMDKGGAWTVKAETNRDSAWATLGMSAQFPGFSAAFPWASLRVLAPASQTFPYHN